VNSGCGVAVGCRQPSRTGLLVRAVILRLHHASNPGLWCHGAGVHARGPTCLRGAIIRLGKATRHAGLAPLPRGISPGLGEWRPRVLRVRWSRRRARTLSGGRERALPLQPAWSSPRLGNAFGAARPGPSLVAVFRACRSERPETETARPFGGEGLGTCRRFLSGGAPRSRLSPSHCVSGQTGYWPSDV